MVGKKLGFAVKKKVIPGRNYVEVETSEPLQQSKFLS